MQRLSRVLLAAAFAVGGASAFLLPSVSRTTVQVSQHIQVGGWVCDWVDRGLLETMARTRLLGVAVSAMRKRFMVDDNTITWPLPHRHRPFLYMYVKL